MDNQQILRLKNTVWNALKSANFDITKASENTTAYSRENGQRFRK